MPKDLTTKMAAYVKPELAAMHNHIKLQLKGKTNIIQNLGKAGWVEIL